MIKKIIKSFLVMAILLISVLNVKTVEAADAVRVYGGSSMDSAPTLSIPSNYNDDAGSYYFVSNTGHYWFKFVVSSDDASGAGTFYNISVTDISVTTNAPGSWYNVEYELTKNSGEVIFSGRMNSGNGWGNRKLSAGTYYLHIFSGNGNVGFSISKMKDDVGDTSDVAKTIKNTTKYSQKLNGNYDIDYYKFVATGTQAKVSVTNVDSNADLIANIYDSTMNSITDSGYWNLENKETWSTRINTTKGKTYYVSVGYRYGNSRLSNYNISVDMTTPVTSVTLNKFSHSMNVGSSFTLKPTVGPSNATNKAVSWSSDNTRVATVNSSGKVTGVGVGSATITATAKDGSGVYATCTFNIILAQPKLVNIYNSANGADIRFNKVAGATYYRIYRKLNGVWSYIDTVQASTLETVGGSLRYIDTSVRNNYGQGYIYSVAARDSGYYNANESTYNANGLPLYRLKQPTISSVSAKGSGRVEVKWGWVNCQGYELQYSDNGGKTWTKAKQVGQSTTSQTITGLKKNTKYAFRIRCQKTNKDRGTTWSQYSEWKSVTVK